MTKGFIEVEEISGMKMLIAVDAISVVFDRPCFIQLKTAAEDGDGWKVKQSYEEVLRLITKAQKEGGE